MIPLFKPTRTYQERSLSRTIILQQCVLQKIITFKFFGERVKTHVSFKTINHIKVMEEGGMEMFTFVPSVWRISMHA